MAMSEFVKKIALNVNIDKESLSSVSKSLSKAVEAGIVDEKTSKALAAQFRQSQLKSGALQKIDEEISKFEDIQTKEAKQYVRQLKRAKRGLTLKDTVGAEFKSTVSSVLLSGLKSVGNAFLTSLKNTFTDAWKELDNILSYSKLSSSTTRDLAFRYGFTGSQAYGFSKAQSMLGIQSEEDLMYMNAQERRQFLDAFNKYTEKYDKLYDQGFFTQLQEYQVEMNEFKEDMKLEIVDFFMENKDTIKTALKALITLSEYTIKALSVLVSGIAGPQTKSASDIVNSYSSRSVNIKVDNTFNGVSKENSAQIGSLWKNEFAQVRAALLS